jgi:competence protein ComEC
LKIQYQIPIYKEAPFIRPLVAFVFGILLQWYVGLPILVVVSIFLFCIPIWWLAGKILKSILYAAYLKSICIHIIFIIFGVLLCHLCLIKNNSNFFANNSNYKQLKIQISEPLQEKQKTYKATANVIAAFNNDTIVYKTGKLIVYFNKDSTIKQLPQFGDEIIINKPTLPIANSGNPGGFNYAQFSLFQGLTHQLFLKPKDYAIVKNNAPKFWKLIYNIRDHVLSILTTYFANIKIRGIAEALVIGYRNDMDKDINQAYSNTGTIHVIAISGLHLGLIYAALVFLFSPLLKYKKTKKWAQILKPIIILIVLWLFTLLAGGAASILRSAIMFSCIVIGESLGKKASIYNTLAISAFIILLLNPFALWDVGFQLSYAAVLSIVMFMQPIYKLLYFKNKWLNMFWKLNAITLSAQILTFPIILYHFHQFPNYFLIANIIAVPLSTIILALVVGVIVFSSISIVASFLALLSAYCIQFMNGFVTKIDQLPFAKIDFIQHHISVSLLLYILLFCIAGWLFYKNKKLAFASLLILFTLGIVHLINQYKLQHQQHIIVYNINGSTAIDFIKGKKYWFVGDSTVSNNVSMHNFHIKPSRTYYQALAIDSNLVMSANPYHNFMNKTILVANQNYSFQKQLPVPIDILILSHNTKTNIDSLVAKANIKQIIADASNSSWKTKKWETDCNRLQIPFYNVQQNGAFTFTF